MRREILGAALVAGALAAAPSAADAEVVWLCQPGDEANPCRETLETTIYESDGSSRVENPPLPADPPIDCFYVYPTVSGQPGTNANKDKDDELSAIARYQAARFSQQCRVFAPVYRQLTLASIYTGSAEQRAAGAKLAYGDVREAWREYLERDNGGRGVVLIGHSQGTRMLRQLVREEIDPKPEVRSRLVSALLLGGNVLVRKGMRAGGDFANVPACTAATQTGCVVAYSAFNEAPPANARFGRPPATDTSGAGFPAGPDYEVLCTNPASLAANAPTPLTTYLRSEPFPGTIGAALIVMYGGPPPSAPTPWLQPADRYTGSCESEDGANFLLIEPIGSARRLNPSPDAGWGLHLADVNIALGELGGARGVAVAVVPDAAAGGLPDRPAARSSRPASARLRWSRTREQLEPHRGHAGAPGSRRGSARAGARMLAGGLYAVFPSPSPRGRSRVVFTTASGYRIAGVGPGRSLREFRRRFPGRRAVGGRRLSRGPAEHACSSPSIAADARGRAVPSTSWAWGRGGYSRNGRAVSTQIHRAGIHPRRLVGALGLGALLQLLAQVGRLVGATAVRVRALLGRRLLLGPSLGALPPRLLDSQLLGRGILVHGSEGSAG